MRILFDSEYVELLGGDVMSALMLSQIVFWYLPNRKGGSKMAVLKTVDGQTAKWLAKSHLDWTAELGLSQKQSRRCLDVLESRKLICRKVFRFGGVPTTHIRLCLPTGHQIKKPPTAQDLLGFITGSPEGQIDMPSGAVPFAPSALFITEITTEITAEKPGEAPEAAEQHMTAKEIVAQMGKATPISLEGLWRSRVSMLNGGAYQSSLTGKEKGQLKMLANALDGKARETIDWTLEHWQKFASKAQAVKGLATFPVEPHIGFLLAHHDVAVNLQLIAQTVTVPSPPPVTQWEPPANSTVEEPYKPTAEEIEALYASFET